MLLCWLSSVNFGELRGSCSAGSVVVFLAEVGDKVFAHQPTEGVLQLHGLDEEIVLGIEVRCAHGRFKIKAEPFLNAMQAGALGEVEEKHQVENDGRGEDGVAAEEVHLDLHGVAEAA